MASSNARFSPSSLLKLLAILVVIVVLWAAPASSTSRRALESKKNVETGFRITLKHVDSSKNLTVLERIQRWTKRGHRRVQRLNAMLLADDQGVQSPIHAGNGEFLMELSIGTPPASYHAIMDTGSDLIWTQCKPCTECFDQGTPIFDPKNSSSFSKISCSNSLCESLPQSQCAKDRCEYLYTYGDYSSSQGVLAEETFTFGDVSVPGIGFGCGEDNQGDGFTQGAGLVGLGRGPLSLVSQLKEQKFSYCLTSIGDTESSSTLLMGSLANANINKTSNSDNSIITTRLIKNPSQPSFYYLSLEGISVGGTRLPVKKSTFALGDDGTGGLIIDSGTTITYLEESAYGMVRKEFVSQTKLDVDDSSSTGLDLCFKVPSGTTDVNVPKLVFHFDGGDLELLGENYMVGDSRGGVLCLAMGSSSGMSIFGNIQQQNMLVLHDLEKETISFIPTKCNQL